MEFLSLMSKRKVLTICSILIFSFGFSQKLETYDMKTVDMVYRTDNNIYLYQFEPRKGLNYKLNYNSFQNLSVDQLGHGINSKIKIPNTFENNDDYIKGDGYSMDFNKEVGYDERIGILLTTFSNDRELRTNREFEYDGDRGVETFTKLQGIQCEKHIAFLAKSTYTNQKFLFLEDLSGNTIQKIDITKDNPYINHIRGETTIKDNNDNNRTDDFRIISYNQERYAQKYVDHYITFAIHTRIYYFIINNDGEVIRKEYTEHPNNEWLQKVYYYPDSKIWLNLFKKDERFFVKAYHLNKKEIWTRQLPEFSVVNDIKGSSSDFFIIGGATENFGYLGFSNPYVEIIDINTGEIKSAYFKSEKYTSVNTMFCKQNEIIITTGFEQPGERISNFEDIHVSLYRDWVNTDDGTFYGDYFKKAQ